MCIGLSRISYVLILFWREGTQLNIMQGIMFVGGGMILSFQAIQTYVVDAFTLHAASGTLLLSLWQYLNLFTNTSIL